MNARAVRRLSRTMRRLSRAVRWLSRIVVVSGCTLIGAAHADEQIGVVRQVFTRAAPGLLLDARIAGNAADAQTWVEVGPHHPDEDTQFAQAPRELALERGDIVAIEDASALPDGEPRVVRLVARHGTRDALVWQSSKPRR